MIIIHFSHHNHYDRIYFAPHNKYDNNNKQDLHSPFSTPKTVLKSQFLSLWFSLFICHSVPGRAEHQSRVEQNCRCRRTAHKSLQRSLSARGPPPSMSKAGARDHSLSTSYQRDAYASGYTSQAQLAFLKTSYLFFWKTICVIPALSKGGCVSQIRELSFLYKQIA